MVKKKQNFFSSRHGQVTVFVIIAIILVAVAGVALFVTKEGNRPNDSRFFSSANSKPELSNVRSAILDCRDNSILESLNTIGIQGGYASKKPEKNLDIGWAFIPYYYYEGKYILPDRTFIEGELGKDIDTRFSGCIDKLRFNGFNVSHENSRTKALIKRKELSVSIDMPLTIKQDASAITLEMKDAPTVINSSLFEILEVAEYMTMTHKNDSEFICVTCVSDMAQERNLYVNTFSLVDNSVLVVISENYTSEKPYSFEFLNKYTQGTVSNVDIPGVPIGSQDM